LEDFHVELSLDHGKVYSYGCGGTLASLYPTIGSNRAIQIAQRIMHVFMFLASLVRPLSEVGKLKLAADMAQLEFAVSQFVSEHGVTMEQIGDEYKALRAIRPSSSWTRHSSLLHTIQPMFQISSSSTISLCDPQLIACLYHTNTTT